MNIWEQEVKEFESLKEAVEKSKSTETFDSKICEVIFTASVDSDLPAKLVKTNLAACVQSVTRVKATYNWQGDVVQDFESRLAIHTRLSLVDELIAKINQLSDYELPCIIVLPIIGGSQEYLDWVLNCTKNPAKGGQNAN